MDATTINRWVRLRRQVGSAAVESFFRGSSALFGALPIAHPRLHGVEVLRDVRYADDAVPEHRLDVYRPRRASGPLPIVFYVHGGGFRILSKETHWIFGLLFARRGFLVFSIDYRLAPKHPFPAAVEDTFLAWQWVVREAAKYGGDPERIVVAGVSAGGNLVTSLTLASVAPHPTPWAREVFELGVVPTAAVPACPLLQVSDPGRFARGRRVSPFIIDRLSEIAHDYLGTDAHDPRLLDLADPICWLERDFEPVRPLPPFFAPVGTRDLLCDDTRRLEAAIRTLGGTCEATHYPGGFHAFHAFVIDSVARQCWRDKFRFLERHGLGARVADVVPG